MRDWPEVLTELAAEAAAEAWSAGIGDAAGWRRRHQVQETDEAQDRQRMLGILE